MLRSKGFIWRELVRIDSCIYFLNKDLFKYFYWTPLIQGSSLQVEILSVRLSFYHFPYSDSKLTQPPPVDLSHTTSPTVSNVPHPCLPCPPVNWSPFSINWSTNSTQINIIAWGRDMCKFDIFMLMSKKNSKITEMKFGRCHIKKKICQYLYNVKFTKAKLY